MIGHPSSFWGLAILRHPPPLWDPSPHNFLIQLAQGTQLMSYEICTSLVLDTACVSASIPILSVLHVDVPPWFGEYQDIVNVHHHFSFIDEVSENMIHHCLERGW